MYKDSRERHALWTSHCRTQRYVHIMDRLGLAIDREHTKVSYHKALVYQLGRRGWRISEVLGKKRGLTVEENLLHVREELCRLSVIMKNFIAEVRLLPNSTNVIVLIHTLKSISYWSYTYTYFAFLYPSWGSKHLENRATSYIPL